MERFGNGFGDQFKEDIVSPRSTVLQNLLYIACWILIVICGVYAFLMLQVVTVQFSVQGLIMLLVSAGIVVLMFLYKDRAKVEYEYSFTNGNLDFAKVFRQVRRQELGSMDVRKVTACGHVAHESFQRYLSMKDVEKKNWFLNRDGNRFYFYYVKDNKKHMIIIEPSEEMVEMIRKCVDPGVFQG